VEPIKIDGVLSAMKPDARVQFPQAAAPVDESLAKAVVNLSNSLVKGDSDGFAKLLDADGKSALDALVGGGEWDASTSRLEAVRILSIEDLQPQAGSNSMTAARILMAVQEPGDAYVLAWSAFKRSLGWEFSAATAPEGSKARASDWDNALTAGPAAGGSGADISAVIAWAKTEMTRRMDSANKNNGVAAPMPKPDATIAAAIEAGLDPTPEDIKALVDIGTSKRGEGNNVVTEDKVYQFVSQILGMTESAVRDLAKGGGGADAGEKEYQVASPGSIPGIASLNCYVQFAVHELEMMNHPSKPTPADMAKGFARRWSTTDQVVNSERALGEKEAKENRILEPVEFYDMMEAMNERYKSLSMSVPMDKLFARVNELTGIDIGTLQALYEMGKAEKESAAQEDKGPRLRLRLPGRRRR
jgi:hypothetical protein